MQLPATHLENLCEAKKGDMELTDRMMTKTPIKIAYLMDKYHNPYGGTERQILQLIRHLDRRRFEPHVMVFRQSEFSTASSFGCPVSVLGIEKIGHAATMAKLYRYVRKLRSDGFSIAHIFFNDAAIIAPPFLKMAGLRVVVSRRDMGFWYNSTITKMLRVSRLFVDCVIANSQAVKQLVQDREGFPGSKISVIYNGYNRAVVGSAIQEGVREQMGIPPDAKIIGIVANLRPIKRIDDLIKAFGQLAKANSNLWLVIVGTGGLEKSLRNLGHSLGVGNRIVFCGQITHVVPVIQEFAVGVLCSESEGFSNSIIEYMNCAKPTVCTGVGGNVEIVRDGQNGFLVNVGDIDSLADRVGRIVSDQNLADALGRNALASVKDKYDVSRMVAAHEEVYGNLISRLQTRIRNAESVD